MKMKQFLSFSLAALLLVACQPNTNDTMSTLTLTQEWDKTFPKSELVDHCKVTFHNRYGIEPGMTRPSRQAATGRLFPPSRFPVLSAP